MKKVYIFLGLILCLSLIIIVVREKSEIFNKEKLEKYELEKIKSISGIDFNIYESDFEEIFDILDKLKLTDREIEVSGIYTPLYVNLEDGLYAYSLYKNGVVRCTHDKKVFYSTDKNKVDELLAKIEKLTNAYKNEDFYKIEYNNVYSEVNGATLVNLNGNSMIKLTLNADVKKFIVASMKEEDDIESPDGEVLIVQDKTLKFMSEVKKNSVLIIKYNPSDYIHNIIIKFESEYGYKYSITPLYKNGVITFDTKISH